MGIQVLQGVEIRRKPRSIGPDPPWNKGPRSDERGPTSRKCTARLAKEGGVRGSYGIADMKKFRITFTPFKKAFLYIK